MSRIIVTGGAGFIGSHIVEALADRHQVTVIDNLSSGHQRNISAGVELVREDIRSPRMKDVWRDVRPDFVFHLAAQKNVRTSIEDPLFDADINVTGSLNVIEQSRRFGVKKFIFASTAGVYADTKRVPITETDRTAPPSPYGIGKYTIEQYLDFYAKFRRLSTISLRFANVYGPRQDPHGEAGVVAVFTQKLLHHEPLMINGHGRQTRDYIFVADIVQACLLAMKNTQITGQVNIGTGKQTSVNALAQAMSKIAQTKTRLKHRRALPGEVMKSALSPKVAKQQLKWKPAVTLSQGLTATWEWATSTL